MSNDDHRVTSEAYIRLVPSEQVYGQDDRPRTGTPVDFVGRHLAAYEACPPPDNDYHMLDLYQTVGGTYIVRREVNRGFVDVLTVEVYEDRNDLIVAAIGDEHLRLLVDKAGFTVARFVP